MYELKIESARNGQKTCIINNIRLHSAYNPEKEAETFVENIKNDFSPELIIITEPALSYSATFLRKKFPNTILIAIRYTFSFETTNKVWDKVFHYKDISKLQELFTETQLLSALFLSWEPSQRVFPKEYTETWNSIKQILSISKDILATRQFFGKKWFFNIIRFCSLIKSSWSITKGNCPILVVASGPSLKTSIEMIKKHRNEFFLLAVSSAYNCLLAEKIIPDLCISTDGGFWAKMHIKNCKCPIIASAESAIPKNLFDNNKIIPISYEDGAEKDFLTACKINYLVAKRNGTVSGTAIELALDLTSGSIFACGLDLSTNLGYQHFQPNALENINSTKDYRIKPLETRIYPSQLKKESLEIYANWFKQNSKKLGKRLYRLGNYLYPNKLGEIQDISWDFFEDKFAKKQNSEILFPKIHEENLKDKSFRKNEIQKLLKNISAKKEWQENIFPADFLNIKRFPQKKDFQIELNNKIADLIKKIELLFRFTGKYE